MCNNNLYSWYKLFEAYRGGVVMQDDNEIALCAVYILSVSYVLILISDLLVWLGNFLRAGGWL